MPPRCRRRRSISCTIRKVTVTIEGHADERGTREYNLALGERRANAAKNYLVSLGVDANRIAHGQLWQGTPGGDGFERKCMGAEPPRGDCHDQLITFSQ